MGNLRVQTNHEMLLRLDNTEGETYNSSFGLLEVTFGSRGAIRSKIDPGNSLWQSDYSYTKEPSFAL